ncbi:MAG: hypothetical protein ACFE9M_12515 [Promethearchaeota archaeon]
MFWKIRKDREVENYSKIFTRKELANTINKIIEDYGEKGVEKALENQKIFFDVILSGKLGYCLFKGIKKQISPLIFNILYIFTKNYLIIY